MHNETIILCIFENNKLLLFMLFWTKKEMKKF